eukprot:SAG31_NODE_18598_length_630_cov_0.868173_2_plen_62_part_01
MAGRQGSSTAVDLMVYTNQFTSIICLGIRNGLVNHGSLSNPNVKSFPANAANRSLISAPAGK